MCHKQKQQQGSALMVAIFIIVVMSVIGAALVRVLNDSATAGVTETYGARAYHAAQSGIEVFLTELFPHDAPVDSCPARVGHIKDTTAYRVYTFTAPALANCTTTIRCDQTDVTPYVGRHFRIFSTGQCAIGNQRFTRQLLVEARDES
ncbi:hypothetical protein CWE15_05375 [Aliidiomarina taiwanensis]|uniref:Type II secretory pathway component n=1 Tax=Aliidiomarina taiwanensis TaxID=946228 RepID=A0A432X7L4_9GAMM|nr:pilus assembly PilX N-terminal domain-containing protein [Aliidiomarina taiwanensis]RUO42835.1 hypothetical protein CWE15_05375 [Aliidiomarina taiwanensis]